MVGHERSHDGKGIVRMLGLTLPTLRFETIQMVSGLLCLSIECVVTATGQNH